MNVDYSRLKQLVQQAAIQPEGERQVWLAARDDIDPELREEARAVIALWEADTEVASDPGIPLVAPAIPGYRLLSPLARGGMGRVWLAERAGGGFQQTVAIKLMNADASHDAAATARFRAERQILASLDHPNIARLLDGGNTADGQPYLVMERVEGDRIDRWCRQHQLDADAIVGLLIRVAQALQAAHRRLVVHRDLKPGNVLVDQHGEPKLLDFGIAKLLDGGLLEVSRAETSTGAQLLTPRYAAPEQVLGEAISTATDVYSLGVLLYELLSGESPYGAQTLASHRLPAAICEDEPPAPSVRLQQRAQRLDEDGSGKPSRITVEPRQLRGDLDAIVLKCLRKRPADRYPGMDALIDDLQALRDGRAVGARRGSRWYLIRRFVRRYWLPLGAAALLLLSSAAFMLRLSIQLERTERERSRAVVAETKASTEAHAAERARDFLVDLLASTSPARTLGKPIQARELLDQARTQLDSVADAPAVAASLQLTLASAYSALGEPGPSAEVAGQALALLEGPDADPSLRAQALEYRGRALLIMNRYSEAEPLLLEMRSIHERLYADQPERLGRSDLVMGEAARIRGEATDVLVWVDRALQKLPLDDPQRLTALAAAVSAAAIQGDLERAKDDLQRAEAFATTLEPNHPAQVELLLAAATLDRRQGDYSASLAHLEQAETLALSVIGSQAESIGRIFSEKGAALDGLGRYREALDALLRSRAAFAGFEELAASEDANIGAVYESLEDYPKAIEHARRALRVQQRDPDGNRLAIRQVHSNLAQALSLDGQHDEALTLMREAVARSEQEAGADSFQHVLDRFRLAAALRRAAMPAEAMRELHAVEPLFAGITGDPAHPFNFYPKRLRGSIERDLGHRAAAIAGLRDAIAFSIENPGADPVAVAVARTELADMLAGQNPADARQVLAPALQQLRSSFPDGDSISRNEAEALANMLGLASAGE